MSGFMAFKRRQPWRDALIATTGLSVFGLAASMLWDTGLYQWAFLLAFIAVWLLLSISWSNIDYTEKSGNLLAEIMDDNFQQLHERVARLEEALAASSVSSGDD